MTGQSREGRTSDVDDVGVGDPRVDADDWSLDILGLGDMFAFLLEMAGRTGPGRSIRK